MTQVRKDVLKVVGNNPSISQSEVARKIGVSRRVAHYHIKNLEESGLVEVKIHGKSSKCYLKDT